MLGKETVDKVTAFDALFTNNQIQKLKVLISYVDIPMQHQLAIYIKFLELKYTMELLRHYPELSVSPQQPENPSDPARICQEISPYCSPQEQKQLNQFSSLFQAMSHYQEIMDMVKMFQEMFPEGMSFSGEGTPETDSSGGNETSSGASPDMMAAGLGSLFGENMPDLSQLMSMMSMFQPGKSPLTDPSPENESSDSEP